MLKVEVNIDLWQQNRSCPHSASIRQSCPLPLYSPSCDCKSPAVKPVCFFFWAEIPDSKGRRPLVKKLTSRSLRKCIWVMCHMIYVGLVMYCTSRLCFGLLLYGCNSKQNKQWCWCWWSSGIYHLKVTPKPHLKRFKITDVLFCPLTLYVVNTKNIFPTLCVIIRGHIWACQWRFEIAFSSNLDCVEWGIISTMLIL